MFAKFGEAGNTTCGTGRKHVDQLLHCQLLLRCLRQATLYKDGLGLPSFAAACQAAAEIGRWTPHDHYAASDIPRRGLPTGMQVVGERNGGLVYHLHTHNAC